MFTLIFHRKKNPAIQRYETIEIKTIETTNKNNKLFYLFRGFLCVPLFRMLLMFLFVGSWLSLKSPLSFNLLCYDRFIWPDVRLQPFSFHTQTIVNVLFLICSRFFSTDTKHIQDSCSFFIIFELFFFVSEVLDRNRFGSCN